MIVKKVLSGILGLMFCGTLGWSATAPTRAESDSEARLVLLLVVDQLRYDYLQRLQGEFQGGFKRLLDKGVYFTDAHQNHANTSTGPGHASLSSGFHPARSGIVGNSWYDRQRGHSVNCVEDPDSEALEADWPGRSPALLEVDTLGDWIKASHPGSKAFAASRKDRGAILLGGRQAEGAFWYGDDGRFLTSDYYMDRYPAWFQKFAEQRFPDNYFGKPWQPLPLSREKAAQAGFEEVDEGVFQRRFPRALGGPTLSPDSRFYSDFSACPLMDAYLVELAKAIIVGENLGADSEPDLLGLSFSTLDAVGHSYGPNSPEVLDVLLRLDRQLGELFQFIDERIGLDSVLVALSSDHGVLDLPEYRSSKDLEGGRPELEDILCFQSVLAELKADLGDEQWLLSSLYLNYETLARKNLLRESVERGLADRLARCSAVEKVWTRSELEAASPPFPEGSLMERYQNGFHPGRSPDLFIQLKKFWLGSTGRGTSHGSPYDYDTHVPLILMVPGVAPNRITRRVATVDLAPTLASLLGIAAPADLDGIDRSPLLRPQPAAR